MIRVVFLTLLTLGVVSLAGRSAERQLPVAPPPREVRPDGSRDPAPQPEAPAKAEDPAVVVGRIIKNSNAVGDKLAKTDTGTDTRKTQDKILSDIDSLINRQENPPPPKPDDKQDKDKNKDMSKDPMKDMPPPKGGDKSMDKKGMGQPDMMPMDGMSGMGGMNDSQPMGGHRPRMGEQKGDNKQQSNAKPMGSDKKPGGQKKNQNNSKGQAGTAGGSPGGKTPPGKPALPIEEDLTKDVWGHLPDKLRQQMTQYYKEDLMPKYSELLRLYYSSLAEKQANPMLPRN